MQLAASLRGQPTHNMGGIPGYPKRLTIRFRLAADGSVTGFDVSGFSFRKLVEASG